jgi:hypothetical protein
VNDFLSNKRKVHQYEIAFRVGLFALGVAYAQLLTADIGSYINRTETLSWTSLPYRDFLWEYPPLTVIVMPMIALVDHSRIGLVWLFGATMAVLEYCSLLLVRRFANTTREFKAMTVAWNLSVLPISLLAWFRFDYLPVFFAALGLGALLQHRRRLIVVSIVLGFLAKLWPILLVVPLFVQRRYRDIAFAVAGCAVTTLAWYAWSPDGFHEFMDFRKGEGFQVETLPGSLLYLAGRDWVFSFGAANIPDNGWQWLQPVLLAATIVSISAVALLAWRKQPHERDDVMVMAAVVALSLVFSRLLSVQFLVWLAPFIVMRAAQHPRIAGLYAVINAITIGFAFLYGRLMDGNVFLEIVLVFRNVLLVGLTIAIVRAAFRPVTLPSEEAEVDRSIAPA